MGEEETAEERVEIPPRRVADAVSSPLELLSRPRFSPNPGDRGSLGCKCEDCDGDCTGLPEEFSASSWTKSSPVRKAWSE